jgi:hypothetical protein
VLFFRGKRSHKAKGFFFFSFFSFFFFFSLSSLVFQQMHRYPNDLPAGQPLFIESREFSLSLTVSPGNYILMPCTFDPGQHGRFFLSVYAEDPVVCGEMGFGPSEPAKLVRVDVSDIAKLNRPDEPSPEPPRKAEARPAPSPAPAPAAAPSGEPICCVCNKSTKGTKSFRMEGRRYHVQCFRCAACDCLLDPSDFYTDVAGDTVCADCNI